MVTYLTHPPVSGDSANLGSPAARYF